jgi:hypothetical protein
MAFGVGSTLLVQRDIDNYRPRTRKPRSQQWQRATGATAEAALKLLTDALDAVPKTGKDLRMVAKHRYHVFVLVHSRSRRFQTWLYESDRRRYTVAWGPTFSEEQYRILAEL